MEVLVRIAKAKFVKATGETQSDSKALEMLIDDHIMEKYHDCQWEMFRQ
jgi:hypothetical protein